MTRLLISPRSLTRKKNPELEALAAQGYELIHTSAGQTPSEAELLDLVPGVVGWIAGVEPISTRVLDTADALRVISRNGSGTDNVPMDEARSRGIAVRRVVGGNARAVAELAITLILDTLRHVSYSNVALKQSRWQRLMGMEIANRTIGVVGCGAIGQEVVRLVLALGASAIAYDPFPNRDFAPRGMFRWAGLDELLTQADTISLHCPSPANGRVLIDADALAAMQPQARLINTARAALVDQDAVLAALEAEQLAGFASDVFDTEPPDPHPLYAHDRVITTAHIGAYTQESVSATTRIAIDNLLDVLREHEAAV